MPRPLRLPAVLAAALLGVGLSGCAVWQLPAGWGTGNGAARSVVAPAPSASGVPPGSPQPGGPPPSSLKAFDTVIKDATRIDGLLTLYRKDEKVWIALKPTDIGQSFFLSPKVATGIGEAGLYGGLYDTARVIEFRRIHNQVQMIARNMRFVARAGTPAARAVAAAFSPSLLASATVASQPDPHTNAVLVEANSLFLTDMLAIAPDLQRNYRQGYAFDARNSAITGLRAQAESVSLQVLAHYATAAIAVAPPGLAPGAPRPTTPRSLPDPRSLFMTLEYSIGKLPEQAMHPRAADPRLGHFVTREQDFGNELARTPTVRYVNRWRLEKKDPNAALSEPVKPIVYWLDRTIPLEYRDAITGGVLEWNKAFERIGFKDAIQVKVQPDDATLDTLDYAVTSVRWLTNSAPGFGAIGLSHVDPRSGEILGADIAIESLSSRAVRTLRAQVLAPRAGDAQRLLQSPIALGAADEPDASGTNGAAFDPMHCDYADFEADQLAYGLDVLAARGELDPDSPEAERFVLAYLRDVAMHETGHTLGLRHNFRASRLYTDAQLSDPEFTRSHALTGSVMEYAPINLAAPGAPRVAPFQTTLGPYDYWAIAYAYKPIAPEIEKAELARIAARSDEPELAYGSDEDNALGIDPDSLKLDLGRDAAAYASKRFAIARDLIRRQETRVLAPDQDYAVLRRVLAHAVRDAATAAGTLARQIGGVRTLRDFPGSGRDPIEPLDAAAQRTALDVLVRGWFGSEIFSISPALQRRLAPDFAARSDALAAGAGPVATEFSLARDVLGVQRALLATLLSDAVAARILDNQADVKSGRAPLQLTELYIRLDRAIWTELASASDITAARRELQRAHLDHLATLLLRPTAASRVDRRGLVRVQAQGLLSRIDAALRQGGRSLDARAHLQDCADTLRQALSAKLLRSGL